MSYFQKFLSCTAQRLRLSIVSAMAITLLTACGGGGSDSGNQRAAEISRKQILAVQATAASELQILELVKVAEVRVSRTLFDYTFQIRLRNTGRNAYKDVMLTLTSVGTGAIIRDGNAALGSIAAGVNILVSDTVTIRQDRTQTLS